jgi:translation initiation factor IF-1
MAKEELLEMRGTVRELLPNAMFRVELENAMKYWATPPAKCARTASAFWWVTKFCANSHLMI